MGARPSKALRKTHLSSKLVQEFGQRLPVGGPELSWMHVWIDPLDDKFSSNFEWKVDFVYDYANDSSVDDYNIMIISGSPLVLLSSMSLE